MKRLSIAGPLLVGLPCVLFATIALSSCAADATSPSSVQNSTTQDTTKQDTTKQDSTSQSSATVLKIEGTIRLWTDSSIVKSAVVQFMLSTDVGTSSAVDTTTDGTYVVQAQVPGGCAGRDSVGAVVNVRALGYRQHSPYNAKFVCTTATQTLDLLVDLPAPFAPTPQAVAGNLTATGVSAGWAFACATAAGGAYCWGVGGEGSALGVDPTAGDVTQPALVPNGAGLTGVSAGSSTACGLDQNGAAWCWGANGWGNLGVSDSTLYFASQAMAVETDLRFTQVGAGSYAVCGLTGAGAVYCWGNGATLGAGDSLRDAHFHPTPARVASARTFVQVSEGFEHTCALDDGGNAWCWGRNSLDQLGNPTAPDGYYVTTPQQVVGGHQFASITVGGDHACGLTAAGEAWCWGSNGVGQLGDGKGGDATATPVAVAGGHTFTALFGGIATTCGLTADGSAYCWGDDNEGQLGLGGQASDDVCGTSYCALEPRPVAGGLAFATLGAGHFLTCGVTTAGKLYCWGTKEALGTG